MSGSKKTVTLHDVPTKAAELEEYVAALFQSSRHFVEKQVIEREGTEILELDAVATDYETGLPQQVLVEAKSGGWGFADIFKVLGWMTYLDIPMGAFFVSKPMEEKESALVTKKCSLLDIRFVHIAKFAEARTRFEEAGFT